MSWMLPAVGIGTSIAGAIGGGGSRIPDKPFVNPGDFDFNFNLDQNDPELMQMGRRTVLGGQRNARDIMDEGARSGLLGTGTLFNQLNRNQLNTNRELEGNYGDVYSARRGEAFTAHLNRLNFLEGLESQRQGALYGRGSQEYGTRQGGLQSIGGLGGRFLLDYYRKKYLGDLGQGAGGQAQPRSPWDESSGWAGDSGMRPDPYNPAYGWGTLPGDAFP